MTLVQDSVKITCDIEDMSKEEIQAYINRGREAHSTLKLIGVGITDAKNDEVDVSYEYDKAPFDRVRRITGYLVGTLDRFNDAKRKEVEDRVSHEIQDDCEDVYIDG